MKLNQLLVLLFVVSATGSVMAMEQVVVSKARLNFGLDEQMCIRAYSKQNMKFLIKPKDFMGKNILDFLNEQDRVIVGQAFTDAVEQKRTVQAPYTLEQKNFIATITALKKCPGSHTYFVKVQEQK